MTWLQVHDTLRDHRKVMAAAEALRKPEAQVVGHLVCLWLWSLENAQAGLLPGSLRTIAKAALWAGKPETLVDALVTAGLLDREGDDYLIHDWDEYTGRLMEARRAHAERERQRRRRVRAKAEPSKELPRRARTARASRPHRAPLELEQREKREEQPPPPLAAAPGPTPHPAAAPAAAAAAAVSWLEDEITSFLPESKMVLWREQFGALDPNMGGNWLDRALKVAEERGHHFVEDEYTERRLGQALVRIEHRVRLPSGTPGHARKPAGLAWEMLMDEFGVQKAFPDAPP